MFIANDRGRTELGNRITWRQVQVAQPACELQEYGGIRGFELGAPDRNDAIAIAKSCFDISVFGCRSVSGPPNVICNSLAVGLCILVLAQMPGQGELDSIENCALANAVPAVEYREVFGEIEPHPLPVSAETARSEEHTSELQSLMRIPYAVFC